MARHRPIPGHKFAGINYGASARCECGWHSSTWFGQGARSNAYGEWREHVRICARASTTAP